MPTLVFLVIASISLLLTVIRLRIIWRQQNYSRQKAAVTIAFGLGITFYLSFLGPVAVANNFKMEAGLFLFIHYISLGIGILTYFISLFILHYYDINRK